MIIQSKVNKDKKSLFMILGVICGFLGIGICRLLTFHGAILSHIYVQNGIFYVDNWNYLGMEMGVIGVIIGFSGALLGICVNKL